MKAFACAVSATYLLSACATSAVDDGASDEREVVFSCANGESLAVRFFPNQGAAVLIRNGHPLELQQQPSGSGFIYSNGTHTIRGKGDDLILEIGNMVPIQCKTR